MAETNKTFPKIKDDPFYYLLLIVGLSAAVLSLMFRNTPIEDIGDWLAVASGTWLIARSYYTD